ncbi:MAG: carboxypeptidase-like regulatory domain-containing protein [Planctomycetota bacterium]
MRRWTSIGALVLLALVSVWWSGGRGSSERVRAPSVAPEARRTNAPLVAAAAEAPPAPSERDKVVADSKSTLPDARDPAETRRLSGSIVGRVHDANGAARDGVVARVTDAEGKGVKTECTTGEFRAEGLAAGHYWLAVSARGHRTAFAEVELAAGTTEKLDFVLGAKLVLDVLAQTRDGLPYERVKPTMGALLAVAHARPLDTWDAAIEGQVDALYDLGRFREADTRASEGGIGVLELEGEPPVWVHLVLGQRVLARELVPLGATEVVFRLDGKAADELANLRVRLFDPAGQPTPANHVLLYGRSSGFMPNVDGLEVIEIPGLAPGSYRLSIASAQFGQATRALQLEPGWNEVEVRFATLVALRGRVVDAHGLPIAGAGEDPTVLLGSFDPTNGAITWDESMHFGVDLDGSFALTVGSGQHALRAHAHGSPSSIVRVDTRQGPVEGVLLPLLAPVAVVLRREHGDWRGARYAVLDAEGQALAQGAFRGPEPVKLRLFAGQHRLLVSAPDGAPLYDRSFVVESDTLVLPLAW